MRKYFIAFVCFLVALNSNAQEIQIELGQMDPVSSGFRGTYVSMFIFSDFDNFYFPVKVTTSEHRMFQYSPQTSTLTTLDNTQNIGTLMGIVENRFIFFRNREEIEGEERSQYKFYMYDTVDGVRVEDLNFELLKRDSGSSHWLEYYQNGQAFVQISPFTDDEMGKSAKIALWDFTTAAVNTLNLNVELQHMSPDKLHVLLLNDLSGRSQNGGRFNIYSIFQEETLGYFKNDSPAYYGYNLRRTGRFLNNEIVLIPQEYGEGIFYLYSIHDYEKSVALRFDTSVGEDIASLYFLPDLSYALSYPGWYSIDTTPFRDWLDENGFLFKETTGIAIDTNINVRENPNLEAQIFGQLQDGDELEVLDRSGIKVQIGNMEEWWYKIRRVSDGLEGWAYGAFVEVDEEQGLLGAELLGLENILVEEE